MKKLLIGLVVVVGLLSAYYTFAVWDEEYDLDELKEVSFDPSLSYCSYTITNDPCKESRFKKGQQICIVCCVKRKPPWPEKSGPNNICPKKIEFEEASNGCDIEATRIRRSCASCDPKTASGVFECPNP